MSEIDRITVKEWLSLMPEPFREAIPSDAPQKIMGADSEIIFQMFSAVSEADDRVDSLLEDLGAAGGLYLLAKLSDQYNKYGDLISDLERFAAKHPAARAIIDALTAKVGERVTKTLASDVSYLRMLAAATPKPNPMMSMLGAAIR